MNLVSEHDQNRVRDLEHEVQALAENFQALRNVLDAIRAMVEDRDGSR
jgi:prefoldin subunit 5